MNDSEETDKRDRVGIDFLFLPTLPQRLTLAGILVFVVITVGDPSYSAYAWAEILALLSVAGSLAARDSIQNAGGKAARQRAFAAILGVMLYRSLARACWSRGISGIVSFDEYQQDW